MIRLRTLCKKSNYLFYINKAHYSSPGAIVGTHPAITILRGHGRERIAPKHYVTVCETAKRTAMNKYLMQRAADVLLIVGDSAEQRQIRHSLHKAKVNNRLHHVGNTAEAASYLRRDGPYMYAPTPGLVLLDASLPRGGVIDLISVLKTDEQFAGIPVIVLVGSESERQSVENCICTVDGTLQKPFDLKELVQILFSIDTLSFLLLQSPRTI